MEVKRTSFFVACIKCGTPSKSVLEKSGEYNDILMEVLQRVASTNKEWSKTDIVYLSFNATKGFLPKVKTLDDFDAVVITGSGNSANDTYPWVLKLSSFIKEVYQKKPSMRLFGVCFGHQIICKALFETSEVDALPQDPVVCRNPKGWEVGVHPIDLSTGFLTRFGPVESNSSSPTHMRLQMVHQDQVNVESLPKDFINIGMSKIEMVLDFIKPISGEESVKGSMEQSLKESPNDCTFGALVILKFFREKAVDEVVREAVAKEADEGVEEEVEGEAAEEEAEEAEDTVLDGELIEEVVWDSLCALCQNLFVETRGECAGYSGAGETAENPDHGVTNN